MNSPPDADTLMKRHGYISVKEEQIIGERRLRIATKKHREKEMDLFINSDDGSSAFGILFDKVYPFQRTGDNWSAITMDDDDNMITSYILYKADKKKFVWFINDFEYPL